MKKRLTILANLGRWHAFALVAAALVFALVALAPAAPALAQDATTAETTARLRFREGPGLDYEIIQVLDVGTEVTFTGLRDESGDWVQVSLEDGSVGWVAGEWLTATPDMDTLEVWQPPAEEEVEEEGTATFSPDVVTTTTTANLNLRDAPSLSGTILETLPQGTVVGFTGFTDASGRWALVDAATGPTGWVATDWLAFVPDELEVRPSERVEEEEMPVDEGVDFAADVVTATTTANLNIREEPSLNATILDTLPEGTVVGFTGFTDATGNWVLVDAATGPTGWVWADFLSAVPAELATWTGDS